MHSPVRARLATSCWARLCFQQSCLPFRPLPYLIWPITCGNSTGRNDLTLSRLPPILLPFQKQSPVCNSVAGSRRGFGGICTRRHQARQVTRETLNDLGGTTCLTLLVSCGLIRCVFFGVSRIIIICHIIRHC